MAPQLDYLDPIPDARQAAFEHARKSGVNAWLYVDKSLKQYVSLGEMDMKHLPAPIDTDENGFYFVFNKEDIDEGKGILTAIPVDVRTVLVSVFDRSSIKC